MIARTYTVEIPKDQYNPESPIWKSWHGKTVCVSYYWMGSAFDMDSAYDGNPRKFVWIHRAGTGGPVTLLRREWLKKQEEVQA